MGNIKNERGDKMRYTIEKVFCSHGYTCVVAFQDIGHRCGYVGIPKSHTLWGIHYNDNKLNKLDVLNDDIGKRNVITLLFVGNNKYTSPSVYFDVHGSITYSDSGNYPIENDDLWWYGYDCAHYGDKKDLDNIQKDLLGLLLEFYDELNKHGIVRDLKYCIDECVNLAKQLFEYDIKIKALQGA